MAEKILMSFSVKFKLLLDAASHTLRLLLRRLFGINLLTFQSQPI